MSLDDLTPEQLVLGALLLDEERISAVSALVGVDDFEDGHDRDIYRAILGLHRRSSLVDFLTVLEELRSFAPAEHCCQKYLVELAQAVTSSAHALHHAKLVAERSDRRRAARVLEAALRQVGVTSAGNAEIYEVLEGLRRELPAPRDVGVPGGARMAATTRPRWLADEAMLGLAGDFVRLVSPESEAHPAALLVQFLVGFGSAVGSRPHFLAESDRHGANLFAVLVGDTSKGRKGTSWGHCRRVLELADPAWASRVMCGLSSGEGVIQQVRDGITTSECRADGTYQEIPLDPGVEDKRLCVVEGEFASVLRVLQRDGNTLSALLRNAWDRLLLCTLTKSPLRATGAHVAIVAHVTKYEALRYLDRNEMGNGFGNRFLWIWVQRSKVLPEGGNLDPHALEQFARQVSEALRFARSVERVTRDPEAAALWRDVYRGLSDGKPGLLGAMIARAEAQVMRLALLYALLDHSSVIQEPHLRAALAVWDYAEQSARYVFGEAIGDPVADAILKALREHPHGMTRTELRDYFHRNRRGTELDQAIERLRELGLVRSQQVLTAGRPAERLFVTTETTKTTERHAAESGLSSSPSFRSSSADSEEGVS